MAVLSRKSTDGSQRSRGDTINLMKGWPNPSLLPRELLLKAAETVLSDNNASTYALLYGPYEGHQQLREQLALWLTEFYRPSTAISADRISITGGASQSLACLLQVFTDPIFTKNVWIIAPAYMLAFRIFDDAGLHAKMRAVPEDDEGIDIAFLRERLSQAKEDDSPDSRKDALKPAGPWRKLYRHVIYAVPTFSNPSSKTMTLRRREELVRLARQFDALIVTDDVYDQLQWPTDARASPDTCHHAVLPRLVDVDRTLDGGAERPGSDGFGNTASNGSFSKLCGPGLRTGWVEGTAKLAYGASQAGSTRSGGAPSHLVASFLANMLKTGTVQRHIRNILQPSYASRYQTLVSAVRQHLLPFEVQILHADRDVAGGYFIWLTLPPPLKGATVSQVARERENLIVAPGEIFEVPGDNEHINFPHSLRLCFAWEAENKLAEGIERLARVLRWLN